MRELSSTLKIHQSCISNYCVCVSLEYVAVKKNRNITFLFLQKYNFPVFIYKENITRRNIFIVMAIVTALKAIS